MKRDLRYLRRCVVVTFLCTAVLNGLVLGDTLETKDGQLLDGLFMGGTQNSVRFMVGDQLQTLPISQLLALTFSRPSGPAVAEAAPEVTPLESSVQAADANQPPEKAAPVTVTSGTRLMVRIDQTLDSSRHGAGHMFTGRLEADLVVDGVKLAPRGGRVYGRLVSSKQGGRMAGKSELGIVITDIVINEIPHSVQTTGVQAVSQGSGGKTVRNVATGAAIGRLARGDSKGARRGAAVGLGASVLTKGSKVYVPASTLMEFNLAADLVYVP